MSDETTVAVGVAALVIGAIAAWLPQRNRRQDKRFAEIDEVSTARGAIEVARMQNWTEIVAAHERMERQLMADLADVRSRAEHCERLVRRMRAQLTAAGIDPVEVT